MDQANRPRVSIAMPLYNCERYVAQAVNSLLAQTYSDFELVISDNASTDGSADICRELARRDSRIKYHRFEQNVGGPGNFRRVFELSSGELHKWSTADDYWEPRYLESCIAVLDSCPDVVLAYSKTMLIEDDGRVREKYEDNLILEDSRPSVRFRQLLAQIGLCNAHLGVIRRSAMLKTGLIGPQLASDVHFLAELSLYGKFAVVPDYLFFRRMHPNSSSWDRTDDRHQQQYYDPSGRIKAKLSRAEAMALRSLTAIAWRSGVPLKEKLSLGGYVLRRAFHSRTELWADFRDRAMQAIRRSPDGHAVVFLLGLCV